MDVLLNGNPLTWEVVTPAVASTEGEPSNEGDDTHTRSIGHSMWYNCYGCPLAMLVWQT